MNGMSTLIRRATTETSYSLAHVSTQQWDSCQLSINQEDGPHQHFPCWHPDHKLPSFQNCGNKFLLLQPHSLLYSVIAVWAKTKVNFVMYISPQLKKKRICILKCLNLRKKSERNICFTNICIGKKWAPTLRSNRNQNQTFEQRTEGLMELWILSLSLPPGADPLCHL